MKRFNNLYEQICSPENLYLADKKARRGKNSHGIRIHDKDSDANLWTLHLMLRNKTYKTSAYTTFKVYEPKERIIFRLPYFPDRIVHHAVMNIMEPIFTSLFTADTYSCIKGKGVKAASDALDKALQDVDGTQYCLKLDIKKFYPSVDHQILKSLLRRKIKDRDLLWLLDGIIDSAEGLPIGNYLSQPFGNFYLTYFDHWIKEKMGAQYYIRYTDDMVMLSGSKEFLHELLFHIRKYLRDELNLEVKDNYQIFKVAAYHRAPGRGINVLGYIHYHEHKRLRKPIKRRFAIAVRKNKNSPAIPSYKGWAKHADCKHLLKKLLHETV